MDFADPAVPSLTIPMEDVETVTRATHNIHMNSPTTFPATWWGPYTGLTYKFSQANHHMPQDPNYSGVQILRDPGWLPKWVGCIMICFGIFTMFYLKPYFTRRPQVRKAESVESVKAESKKAAKKKKTAEPVKS